MDSETIASEDGPIKRRPTIEQLMAVAENTDFKIVDGNGALYWLNKALSPIHNNSQGASTNLPLLVSIDTEYNQKGILELGISTLDPQYLSSIYQAPVRDSEDIIFSFCYSKAEARSRSRHIPYLFGPRQDLDDRSLLRLVIDTLNPRDMDGNARDVILIGRSIKSDMKVLKQSSPLDLRSAPNVTAIIDTQTVSATVLGFAQSVSLKSLLTHLGLEYTGLHNAAHDSRYTLRALLMMYLIWRRTYLDEIEENYGKLVARLDLIERIAKSHRVMTLGMSHAPEVWTGNIDPRLMGENLDEEKDLDFARNSADVGNLSCI